MKVIEFKEDYNRTHEMPLELWHELRLLKSIHPRKDIRGLLEMLPDEVAKLVKTSRKRKTVPNGIKLDVVCIDEVAVVDAADQR